MRSVTSRNFKNPKSADFGTFCHYPPNDLSSRLVTFNDISGRIIGLRGVRSSSVDLIHGTRRISADFAVRKDMDKKKI